MIIDAQKKIGPWSEIAVVVPETGLVRRFAYYADTEAGVYSEYVSNEETGKLVVVGREILTRTICGAFDLVNVKTGEVVAEAR